MSVLVKMLRAVFFAVVFTAACLYINAYVQAQLLVANYQAKADKAMKHYEDVSNTLKG
jgi:hypothetical protein